MTPGAGAKCVCLDEPARSVGSLDRFGEPWVLEGAWPSWAPDGWLRHWQGVQRVDGSGFGSPAGLLALTFKAEYGGLVLAAPEGDGARVLRVDRAPEGYPHPGGIQALGSFLFVPLERGKGDSQPARIAGLQLEPGGWRTAWVQEVAGTGAAAVAGTRLADGRYLMVSAGWGTRELEVFVSTTRDLEAPGWRSLGTWDSRNARSILPGTNGPRDRVWARYQNLNFVTRCGDGALFLLAAAGPVWPGVEGEERVDAYRFQVDDSGRVVATLVARRRLFCAGASGRWCHLMAGVGFHVTPAGELIVDAVEHGRSGPAGSARLKTFRSRTAAGKKTPAP